MFTTLSKALQKIHQGDCVTGLSSLPDGTIDLVFADPPFNIGYQYDVYDDRMAAEEYLSWSRSWIQAVYRALKANGTFWLAIGDDFAAELKVESQNVGFHCRSWVIWYYTFGVNCKYKFTRSHTHLFHFVKNVEDFTFRDEDPANRIPSARQLVYADRRANGAGRLPDDTWIIPPASQPSGLTTAVDLSLESIAVPSDGTPETFTLRPQDLAERFQPQEDTWYFPRVAGTFHERAGFHGCQMPEQLLGRIIRTCSNENDIVLDPFSGSASTLVVARKLGRQYIGFELSPEYTAAGTARLEAVRVGDPLVGAAEPTMSAPRTGSDKNSAARQQAAAKKSGSKRKAATAPTLFDADAEESRLIGVTREQLHAAVTKAFRKTHQGYCEDRVIADPELNRAFIDACQAAGLPGNARSWNCILLEQRRAGCHADLDVSRPSGLTLADCDGILSGAEISWSMLLERQRATSLSEILVDPFTAEEFDQLAMAISPGATRFEYRWAALMLQTQSRLLRHRAALFVPPEVYGPDLSFTQSDVETVPEASGAFLLWDGDHLVYTGETLNLRTQLKQLVTSYDQAAWQDVTSVSHFQFFRTETQPDELRAWACCLASRLHPRLNVPDVLIPEGYRASAVEQK